MTDYHPLIARAIEGLDNNTGEARRALYERARTALVTQLRSVEPPLSESDITKERLALEDAIRKVEAEAARRPRTELRESRPPPAPTPRREPPRVEPRTAAPVAPKHAAQEPVEVEAPPTAAPQTARERLLGARSSGSLARQGIRGFRDAVGGVQKLGGATAKAAQSARDMRDSYQPIEDDEAVDEPIDGSAAAQGYVSHAEEEAAAANYGARHSRGREAAYGFDDDDSVLQPAARHMPHGDDEELSARPPRSYRWLVQLVVALIIVVGLVATISWQWPRISGLYQSVTQIGSRPQGQPTRESSAQQKFPGRVPQDQGSGQAPSTGAGSQAVPAVAQRVVLYEEDSSDPQGKRYVGSVIWRTETVSPGPGLAPELAVRADVEIPERHMTMTWSLRRNTDQALPASHTVEIQFTLPADFPGGGIANVPGILMKQSEQARGTPLAGLAVKVTNNFFLIGLSAVDTDVQRNIQLIKERPWFDIPVVYTNGGRAILAMEKGPPGDRAFGDAFAAWEKK
jgi:hypothetical protein